MRNLLLELTDGTIKWKIYSGENILDRFSVNDWKQIASDISSHDEWVEFIAKYLEIVKCYVLEECATSSEIAFVYLYREDSNSVSIHGGGWKNPILYYRGYVLILRCLLEKNIKVRTSCRLSNPAAIRFSRSVGFVPYRYMNDVVHMWISEKRLKSSKLYRRFYVE